jgi:hypothetical protein
MLLDLLAIILEGIECTQIWGNLYFVTFRVLINVSSWLLC